MPSRRWFVSQIGAREHFAVARALHARAHLELLLTDLWCSPSWRGLERLPQPFKSLPGRFHPAIPPERVRAFSGATLRREIGAFVRNKTGHRAFSPYDEFIGIGADFSRRTLALLQKRGVDAQRQAFFGYNTGCLETLEWLQKEGVFSVVDQIDPARVEDELVRQERDKWAGWEDEAAPIPDAYFERLGREWKAASRVLVNSPWAAQALEKQGVPREKLLVVPLAFEAPEEDDEPRKFNQSEPLKVLWLGTVNLRKGIPYLVEAARGLSSVEFIVAGPVEISERAVASVPSNMKFVGRVNRADAGALYRQSDVFVLPTISDGFAITQLEAMAKGLPVITTPRCGEVVTTGRDGILVAPGDASELAEAIRTLDRDRALLRSMSVAAGKRCRDFSLDRYAESLEGAGFCG